MTVEKPDARIVGLEPQYDVAVWMNEKSVTPHGFRWESLISNVRAGLFLRANHCLERVAMQMEGMLAGIIIVQNDLDNLILTQDKSIRVTAVDDGIGGVVPSGQHGVERRDLWLDVRHIIEESAGWVSISWFGEPLSTY